MRLPPSVREIAEKMATRIYTSTGCNFHKQFLEVARKSYKHGIEKEVVQGIASRSKTK